MNEMVKLLLSLSLSGSVLAILIFAVKPLIKHRLSKFIQYCMWIVVLLRLLIPFSFEDSIMNHLFYSSGSSANTGYQSTIQTAAGTGGNITGISTLANVSEIISDNVYKSKAGYINYFIRLSNRYAVYIWLFGAAAALIVNLTGYIRFIRCIKQANKPATDEQNRILAGLSGGRYKVRLVRNQFGATPALIGIFRPYILIPDIDFDEIQLKNILLHELSHLKRFDIAVKWLTMLAASIHWFNPLMHVIKKEINRACELACDEAVIKNLSPEERKAYGNTLIFVVAENKYPAGALQATMCEEKKTLKERLKAIMKHNKKSRLIIILSVFLLAAVVFGAVYLGAGVGRGKDAPPDIYISAEEGNTKAALMGTYDWSYRGKHVIADSDHPVNFEYKWDNIVSVTRGQQLVIGTQKIKADKKYEFTVEQISVYKKDKEPVEYQWAEPGFIDGSLYIQAPPEAGEYIYVLMLNFKNKGTVSYGFDVRVDMLTYNLEEISKCKTPYIGNHIKVLAIAGLLPVADSYFRQQYISMETGSKPYKLTIFYEPKSAAPYKGDWSMLTTDELIYSNLQKNALVSFCMIDNMDEVTFAFRNSQSDGKLETAKYDTFFTFSRASIEKEYGDVSAIGKNLELLKNKLE